MMQKPLSENCNNAFTRRDEGCLLFDVLWLRLPRLLDITICTTDTRGFTKVRRGHAKKKNSQAKKHDQNIIDAE